MNTNVSFISAISTEFVEDFIILYKSIRRFHKNHFILFVDDLSPDDFEKLIIFDDLEIRILDYTNSPAFETNRIVWCKVFLLDELAQNETYLWLDADIVIISDISSVIKAAEKNFTLFSDKISPIACYNKRELYSRLEIDVAPNREKLVVNAGVFGINPERDIVILNTIKEYIKKASEDASLRSLVSCLDQGCVLATIHKLRLYYNVLDCDVMNVKPRLVLSNIIPDGPDALIKHIDETNYGKGLVHYAGPFKSSNYRNNSSRLKVFSDGYPKKSHYIITGFCEGHVRIVSTALAFSASVVSSICEFNTSELTIDAFYKRYDSIAGDRCPVSFEEVSKAASDDKAVLNIIYGHRLINRLEDLCALNSAKVICLVPSLHDFILYSLNDFELYGDSLINHSEEYLSHYRSDGKEHIDNLFKVHDIETDHVFDCYIKEYVAYIRKINKTNADIFMVDEFRSLYKIPNAIGAEKHIEIKSYNRIVREGEMKIKKYAKDEYLRLMRSYTRLPKHINDFNLPLYKML
jgi:hypothetical protein